MDKNNDYDIISTMVQGQLPPAPDADGTEMQLETTRLMRDAEENARQFLKEPIPAERERWTNEKVQIKRFLHDLKAMQEEMRRSRYAYLFGNTRNIVDQLRSREIEINRRENEAQIAQVIGPRLEKVERQQQETYKRELRQFLNIVQESRRRAEGMSQPDAALLRDLSALQERIQALLQNLPQNEEEIEALGTEVRGMSDRVGQALQEQRATEERAREEASQRQAGEGQGGTTIKPFPMSIKFQAATSGTVRNLMTGRASSKKTLSGMLFNYIGGRAMPSLHSEAAGAVPGEKKQDQGGGGEKNETEKKPDEKKKEGEGQEKKKAA